MTNGTRVSTHEALSAGLIVGSRAQDIAGALYAFAVSIAGAVQTYRDNRAALRRRRRTEEILNGLPESTRRDINWPARRHEILPSTERQIW